MAGLLGKVTDLVTDDMKKQVTKWITIIAVALILVGNFTPVSYLLHENYTYSNFDGSFIDSEEAGGKPAYLTVTYDFRDFLKKHPDKAQKDTTLYRTFTIKPWRFWQWSDFLFCPGRFKLPYKPQ